MKKCDFCENCTQEGKCLFPCEPGKCSDAVGRFTEYMMRAAGKTETRNVNKSINIKKGR